MLGGGSEGRRWQTHDLVVKMCRTPANQTDRHRYQSVGSGIWRGDRQAHNLPRLHIGYTFFSCKQA